MGSWFKADSSTLKNKDNSKKVDNVIYSDPDPELYIIVDEYFSTDQLLILKKILKKILSREIAISVIYCYVILEEESKILKNIRKHVFDFGVDFLSLIPANSKVITLGRALYSVTKDTGILIDSFYENIFNKTYFWAPEFNNWVFPVDALFKIYNKDKNSWIDDWPKYFFEYQLKTLFTTRWKTERIKPIEKVLIEGKKEVKAFFKKHINEEYVAYDLETSGFDVVKDRIKCFTCTFDGTVGYYLKWKEIDKEDLNNFLKGKYQIGSNLKFDCRFLRYRGIPNSRVDFDTMQCGNLLNEMSSASLKTHAWRYTKLGGYELELEKYKAKFSSIMTYDNIRHEVLFPYATTDPIASFQVYEEQLKQLKKYPKIFKYYFSITVPSINMFLDMEMEGVYLNWEKIKEIEIFLKEKRQAIANEIYKLAGFTFNLESTKEVGRVFQHKLKLPNIGAVGKEGYFLSNEDALEEWKGLGYEIPSLLIDYRECSTLIKNFTGEFNKKSGYWQFFNGTDIIYPTFMVQMAKTLRHRAKDPNMQNIPHHGTYGELIRSFFTTPSDEYYISEWDYSGLQLRIIAIMSGDENMRHAFVNTGGDLHSMTARNIFHTDWTVEEFIAVKNEVKYEMERDVAKKCNFGLVFGKSYRSFTNEVIRKKWSKDKCEEYIKEKKIKLERNRDGEADIHLTVGKYIVEQFFDSYPAIVKWIEDFKSEAQLNGYVQCFHGPRRLLPQLLYTGRDTDDHDVAKLLNIAVNSPVQTYEVTIINRAMLKIHQYMKEHKTKSRMILNVHDAIIFYIHKSEKEWIGKIIKDFMEEVYDEYDGIPIAAEGDFADPRNSEKPTYWGYGEKWKVNT